MTSTELPAVSQWLATADPAPDRAALWLSHTGIVVLPLGRLFDAVKVSTDTGHEILAAGLDGPVICDPHPQAVYFLVPPGTAAEWPNDSTSACLGDTAYLTIPVPARVTPPGPYWMQAPDGRGHLVEADALAELLAATAAPGGDPVRWCLWHDGPSETALSPVLAESNSGPPRVIPACQSCRDQTAMIAAEREQARQHPQERTTP